MISTLARAPTWMTGRGPKGSRASHSRQEAICSFSDRSELKRNDRYSGLFFVPDEERRTRIALPFTLGGDDDAFVDNDMQSLFASHPSEHLDILPIKESLHSGLDEMTLHEVELIAGL